MHNVVVQMQVVGISFGSEKKSDPVQDVLFYTAKQPFTAVSQKDLLKQGVKVCRHSTKLSA